MQVPPAQSPSVLDKLSYVLASRQREKVLAAVIPGPKAPMQVARQTGLRLPHVSRTLGQLVRADLVRTVGGASRGRLYGVTSLGVTVFGELTDARGDRMIAPLVRGTHFKNYYHWIAANVGRKSADQILIDAGIDPKRLDADSWYPLRAVLEVLDLIEARAGDGTYDTIRRMMRDEVTNFSTLKRLAVRALPFPVLLELLPGAYNREFNHGRLEVDVSEGRAWMKSYDWMSSPARCALRLGLYEGILAMVGIEGRVSKVACMLRGEPYCAYAIEW